MKTRHKSGTNLSADWHHSGHDLTPQAVSREGPLFACVKIFPVHVDPESTTPVRYNREYIESRKIEIVPDAQGLYTVWDRRRLDFTDDGDIASSYTKLAEGLSYSKAIKAMQDSHKAWEKEGFTGKETVVQPFNPPEPAA